MTRAAKCTGARGYLHKWCRIHFVSKHVSNNFFHIGITFLGNTCDEFATVDATVILQFLTSVIAALGENGL
jgi:hypothetical protein